MLDLMGCITGKKQYDTKALAEEALVAHRSRFIFRDNSGPIAVYQCDDCGEWHFTSQGPVSEVLMSSETKKLIKTQQDADYWVKKLGY